MGQNKGAHWRPTLIPNSHFGENDPVREVGFKGGLPMGFKLKECCMKNNSGLVLAIETALRVTSVCDYRPWSQIKEALEAYIEVHNSARLLDDVEESKRHKLR